MKDRKELIEELKTREESEFHLYDLEKLEKLVIISKKEEDDLEKLNKIQDYKKKWHCSGRESEREGNDVEYCIFAYNAFKKHHHPTDKCPGDCKFYKKLHEK